MHALRIELLLDFILPPMREGLGAEGAGSVEPLRKGTVGGYS